MAHCLCVCVHAEQHCIKDFAIILYVMYQYDFNLYIYVIILILYEQYFKLPLNCIGDLIMNIFY